VEARISLFESAGQTLELALVRDISDRKKTERALRHLAEIGELATMIVHEVRNPLTTVLMGLNFFKRLDLDRSRIQTLEARSRRGRSPEAIAQRNFALCQRTSSGKRIIEINAYIEKSWKPCARILPQHRTRFNFPRTNGLRSSSRCG
jgi:signal transduction histidine kinase